MTYLTRFIEPILLKYLRLFPVVSVTGPRQSGKSTLLRHLLADYRYITFDDPTHLAHFENDPKDFMKVYDDRVIFDEAQKCPELFNYIKMAVDNDRQNYGKYVLSGSSQFTLLKNITETLAGRIGLLSLLPFQYAEIPTELRDGSLLNGCYPQVVTQQYEGASEWYGSYVATYIERDVRNITNIGDLRSFQRLIELLAANVAQPINMSTYANDLGISVPTVKSWLSVLEASYIIFLLPPYYKNFGKRLTKAPKLYFYDTGLVNYLVGIRDKEHLKKGPMAGALFENYLISDVYKTQLNFNTNHSLFYLCVNNREEVDLLIDKKNSLDLIEIKNNATFKPEMIKHIKTFLSAEDQGLLLYPGSNYQYSEQIQAINFEEYLLQATISQ
jgi:predicted AAA+ superfamily ATPase